MARRGRTAQPAWEALGYDGRARVLQRMQKWMMDNADRVIETICSETGKANEDAQLAELSDGAAAFGFWAKNAPRYLADERVHELWRRVRASQLGEGHGGVPGEADQGRAGDYVSVKM